MTVRHCMFVAAAMMMVACGGNASDKSGSKDESAGKQGEPASEQVLSVVRFSHPGTPMMLSKNEAIEYMATHWWDIVLGEHAGVLCDSTHVNGVPAEDLEQAVADYLFMLSNMPLDLACGYVGGFADRLADEKKSGDAAGAFRVLDPLVQRYFYDPNSPLRDEDIYAPYAGVMASCEALEQDARSKFADECRRCSLNRRGSVAADFGFVTLKGKQYKLHGIKAEYTILFFSNPGCHACKEIIETLGSIEPLQQDIENGRIAVVNVYIDEDVKAWRDYAPIYPDNWYNGFDNAGSIRNDELYDVRAIPSLYLLDKDKKVLLKDAPLEKLLNTQLWQ